MKVVKLFEEKPNQKSNVNSETFDYDLDRMKMAVNSKALLAPKFSSFEEFNEWLMDDSK